MKKTDLHIKFHTRPRTGTLTIVPPLVYGRWDGRRWDGGDGRTKDGRKKDVRTKDAGTKDARTKDARTANSEYSLDGRTEPHLLEYLIYDCYFLSKHENCSCEQYDYNHAPPTASALRKQRLKSTLLNADLLKGFAEISEDVKIRPSERKAARQVFYRLKKAKRSD